MIPIPYIITTTDTASSASRQHWIDTGEYIVNRRAVATLAEAREHVRQERIRIEDKVRPVILGESGGTIGPLPDGTVIEVTYAPVSDPSMHAGWVEIYNRKHAR